MENPLESQERALLDLGLLSRVVCHELNNLIANQRGYARLLSLRSGAPEAARWLGELGAANEGLHALVSGLQAWSRQAATEPANSEADRWPASAAVRSQMIRLRGAGCAMPEPALLRVLAIVADQAGSPPDAWSAPQRMRAPLAGALLGSGEQGLELLSTTIPDLSQGTALASWSASAEHILPEAGAPTAEWQRALVLGLLRQAGGDIGANGSGTPALFELRLPLDGGLMANGET